MYDFRSAWLAADALDAFGIANVAWALATLHTAAMSATTRTVGLDDECGGGLCDALAVAACARASDFKPQELTNLVWAFATLKWRHARLFEQLADVASARLAEFSPQGLSQTLWAYSKLGLTRDDCVMKPSPASIARGSSISQLLVRAEFRRARRRER